MIGSGALDPNPDLLPNNTSLPASSPSVDREGLKLTMNLPAFPDSLAAGFDYATRMNLLKV
jgi:hypothetical protein